MDQFGFNMNNTVKVGFKMPEIMKFKISINDGSGSDKPDSPYVVGNSILYGLSGAFGAGGITGTAELIEEV